MHECVSVTTALEKKTVSNSLFSYCDEGSPDSAGELSVLYVLLSYAMIPR